MVILMETRLSSASDAFEYDPPDETLRVTVLDGATVAIQSSCGDEEEYTPYEAENQSLASKSLSVVQDSDLHIYHALVGQSHLGWSNDAPETEDDTSAHVLEELIAAQVHRDSESIADFASSTLSDEVYDDSGRFELFNDPGASPSHYPNDGGVAWTNGYTPWNRLGSARSDRLLREHCKNPLFNCDPHLIGQVDRTGKSALHYCAENENLKCIDQLLTAEPELLHLQDEEGYTPLHLSVISGNKSVLKYLISQGANVDALDNENHSAIHWATVCGEVDALDTLIGAKANASTPDIHGAYPIHYAAQMCGSVNDLGADERAGLSVLRRLLAFGAKVDVRDRDGRQPLMWAASSGSTDAIVSLVNAGSNVNSVDKDGLSSLHCAASRGHQDCLETLVTLCGCDVDIEDHNGCTPLFYAVTLGHGDCVQYLLGAGANPNAKDKKWRSAAHCGAAKGQLQTLKLLNRSRANLWTKNVRGDLPLHDAVQSGRKDLVRWLITNSISEELVDSSNNEGRTGLHIAAMNNNVEMCKILFDHRASVNPIMRNNKGHLMTPLDAALYKGFRGCAKFIQLHGGVPASKITDKVALQKALLRAGATMDQDFDISPEKARGIIAKTPSLAQEEEALFQMDETNPDMEEPPGTVAPKVEEPIQLVDEATETNPVGLVNALSGRESPYLLAQSPPELKQIAIQTDPTESQEMGTDVPTPIHEPEPKKTSDDEEEIPKSERETRGTQTNVEPNILEHTLPPGGSYEIDESDDHASSNECLSQRKSSSINKRGKTRLRSQLKDGSRRRTRSRHSRNPEAETPSEEEGEDVFDEDDSQLIPGSSRTTETSNLKDSGFSDVNANLSPDEYLLTSQRHKTSVRKFPPLKENSSSLLPLSDDSEDEYQVKPRHKSSSQFEVAKDKIGSASRRMDGYEKGDGTVISVTQAVQNNLRKYQIERRIFQELLELKRIQLRASQVNEHVLVKRLADDYAKSIVNVAGLRQHDGPFTFKEFERYLYGHLIGVQYGRPSSMSRLSALNISKQVNVLIQSKLQNRPRTTSPGPHQVRLLHRTSTQSVPRFKTSDDVDRISKALKRHGIDGGGLGLDHNFDDPTLCTHSTHRCHHAAHAYTGESCASTVRSTNPSKANSARPSKDLVLPKIDSGLNRNVSSAPPNARLVNSIQKFDPNDPLTLELRHGRQSQSVQLPTTTLDRNKKYLVTFTINQSQSGESPRLNQ